MNLVISACKVLVAAFLTIVVVQLGFFAHGVAVSLSSPEPGELSDTFSLAEQWHSKLPLIVAALVIAALGLAFLRMFAEKIPEEGLFGSIARKMALVFGLFVFGSAVAGLSYFIYWTVKTKSSPEPGELSDTFSLFEKGHAYLPIAAGLAVVGIFALAILQKKESGSPMAAVNTLVAGPVLAETG